jgi:hypothetical protein
VNLIFNHVVKFQDVHVANCNILLKRLTGATVVEFHFARLLKACFDQLFFNLTFGCACKWRANCLIVEGICSKSQVQFKNLSEVHTGWNAERCQNDIDWLTVLAIRHIFFWTHG